MSSSLLLVSRVSRVSGIASLVDVASSCLRLMTEKGVCDKQPESDDQAGGQRSHDMLRPIGLIDVSDHRLSHTCKPPLSREPSIYANADFSSKSV